MVMKNQYLQSEHPFAPFVRILGKGKTSSRSFTLDEARTAMAMILAGEVEPVQLGAFLMLLRVKEESADELAGFVMAAREDIRQRLTQACEHDAAMLSASTLQLSAQAAFPTCLPEFSPSAPSLPTRSSTTLSDTTAPYLSTLPGTLPASLQADLDWSSYAGKRKHYPWFLLAVKLLSAHGIRVFMHGASGHTINRLYTEAVLPALDLPVCTSWQGVGTALDNQHFAYLSLQHVCPPLGDIIDLRNIMGLRSPVHTLSRLLNPLDAPYVMQAIFHPAYRVSHQEAASRLGYRNSCVIKGEGGEIERNPDGLCLAKQIVDGVLTEEEWPALFPARHTPEEAFDLDHFLAVWQGQAAHEYGEMAVIGTLAIALRVLQKADSQTAALALAEQWWQTRHNR